MSTIGNKLPDDIVELICAANELDFSMRLTGRILKVDKTVVRKYWDEFGLPQTYNWRGPPISEDEKAKIYQFYKEGYKPKEIADKLGRSDITIYKHLAKANLRPIKHRQSIEGKRPAIEAAFKKGKIPGEIAKTLHVGLGAVRKVRNELGLDAIVYVPCTSYPRLEKIYDAYCTDTPPHAVRGAGLISDTVAKYYRGLRKLDAAPAGKPLTLEDITKSQNKGAKSVCRVWLHFLALQGRWTILSKNKFQKLIP